MALAAGRSPGADGACQVRRYQPPSGCGTRSRAAISHSPGRIAPVCPMVRCTEARGEPAVSLRSAAEDAAERRDGEGVLGGSAEERTVSFGSLHKEVPVVLPGETDPTERLEAVPAHHVLTI